MPNVDEEQAMCDACGERYEKRMKELESELEQSQSRISELEEALHHDKTGLANAVAECRTVAEGRLWILEGRGSYTWDDEEYRKEAGYALHEVIELCKNALNDSWKVASAALDGKPLPEVNRELRDELEQSQARERGLREAIPAIIDECEKTELEGYCKGWKFCLFCKDSTKPGGSIIHKNGCPVGNLKQALSQPAPTGESEAQK
jgi:hypothetical protein